MKPRYCITVKLMMNEVKLLNMDMYIFQREEQDLSDNMPLVELTETVDELYEYVYNQIAIFCKLKWH